MQRQSVVSSRWTVVEALTCLLGCYCICADLSSVLGPVRVLAAAVQVSWSL